MHRPRNTAVVTPTKTILEHDGKHTPTAISKIKRKDWTYREEMASRPAEMAEECARS